MWLSSTRNLFGLAPEGFAMSWRFFGLGARDALNFMGIWVLIGGNNMLLYLAALTNVPPELYEAADIDGASRWQRFWSVTWPQLAPTTFFIVVISTIGGLQGGFEVARVMTEGGPAGTTTTLAYYIYIKAFQEFQMGYASAIAWILFAMIFVMTMVNWRFGSQALND
jgi:multiple sugar transport system permease protein